MLTKIGAYIEEQLSLVPKVTNRELSRDEKIVALTSVYPRDVALFIYRNQKKVDLEQFDIQILYRLPLVPISSTWGFNEFKGNEIHLISVYSKVSGNTAYVLLGNSPKGILEYWGGLDSFLINYDSEGESEIYPLIKMEDSLLRELGKPLMDGKKFGKEIQDIIYNNYPLYMRSPNSPFGIRSRKLEFVARIEKQSFFKDKPHDSTPLSHVIRDEKNNFFFIRSTEYGSHEYVAFETAKGRNIPKTILSHALISFKEAHDGTRNGWRNEGRLVVSNAWADILKSEVKAKLMMTHQTIDKTEYVVKV